MNDSDSSSSYSYDSQDSNEYQYIDENATDQGTIEFVDSIIINTFPHNAIGAVAFRCNPNANFSNGTGFLVAPNLVLTVAHNLYYKKHQITFEDVQFYPSLNGELKNPIKVIDYKYPKQYKTMQRRISQTKNGLRHDYALLKLQKDIKIQQYFKISLKLNNDLEKISIFGYMGFMLENQKQIGRQVGFKGDSQVSIIKIDSQKMELQHSLPSHSGLSGSPILTDDNEVIGIHKAGIVKKGYNVGVLINKEMINNLTKWSNEMNSNNKIEVTQYIRERSLEHSRLLIRTARQRNQLIPTKLVLEKDYQRFPYSFIGRIILQYAGDKTKYGANTAFLISNNLVLTCFSSIYNPQIENFDSSNTNIKLYFIPSSKMAHKEKIAIQKFKFNHQSLNLRNQKLAGKMKNSDMLEDIYYDYCLLKLSRSVELKNSQRLQLAANYEEQFNLFAICGYPSRSKEGLSIQNPKLQWGLGKDLNIYKERHMIAHNVDTKIGMIGSPIIVDQNKVVGIQKFRLRKYHMCRGARLISIDLIQKLFDWNKQLQGKSFIVNYYTSSQDYIQVNNKKQLHFQHKNFKKQIQNKRELTSISSSRCVS